MDSHLLKERALDEGSPVIDSASATFVWRGPQRVFVSGDFQDWSGEPLPLERVGPGLWARTIALPHDAYVEYAFTDAQGKRVKDPLNPLLVDNGIGGRNHFFYMPGSAPSPLGHRARGVPRGRLTRHRVETSGFAIGASRQVVLYQPPVPGPCPLVVVLDGLDYLKLASLTTVVDNLIHTGRIRPVALALVANGGPARTVEYFCSEATRYFLLRKVLPLAHAKLRLVDEQRQPGVHGVLGASLGGLMALYLGLRSPEVFGHVLSQSGAFAIPGEGDTNVFPLARVPPTAPLQVWMDCGVFEQLRDGNQRLLPVLTEAGHRAEYWEYNGGHSYAAWRDDLWRGLEALFPPQPLKNSRRAGGK
jgi:enterochelin esterase-like enzyme